LKGANKLKKERPASRRTTVVEAWTKDGTVSDMKHLHIWEREPAVRSCISVPGSGFSFCLRIEKHCRFGEGEAAAKAKAMQRVDSKAYTSGKKGEEK
jgi:hypothetical protein